jgi:hypothetical protein
LYPQGVTAIGEVEETDILALRPGAPVTIIQLITIKGAPYDRHIVERVSEMEVTVMTA